MFDDDPNILTWVLPSYVPLTCSSFNFYMLPYSDTFQLATIATATTITTTTTIELVRPSNP